MSRLIAMVSSAFLSMLLLIEMVLPVYAAAPAISSFSPTSGNAGVAVTITGTGFTGATSVQFNGTEASFSVDSDTSITATVPSGATTGKIAVKTPSGTATSADAFTTDVPTISSFTPNHGNAGDLVTITGTKFTGATSVQYNGTEAIFTADSDTSITATVPDASITGSIVVKTPFGTATSVAVFTRDLPAITSFTPVSGSIGQNVVINGSGFTLATDVKLNGLAIVFSVERDNTIIATVPIGSTKGKVTVTIPSGTITSTMDFVVDGLKSLGVTLDPGAGYIGPMSGVALNYSLAGPRLYTGTLALNGVGSALLDELQPGVYDLSLTGSHWLKRVITGINVDGVNCVSTALANGDADGGNSVDLFDYVVLDSHFNSTNKMADLDGDGRVNLFDYIMIDRSFGAQGDGAATSEPKVLSSKNTSMTANGGTIAPPAFYADAPTIIIPAGALNGSGIVTTSVLDRVPVPPSNPSSVLVGHPMRMLVTGTDLADGAKLTVSAPITLGNNERAIIAYEQNGVWVAAGSTVSGGKISGDFMLPASNVTNSKQVPAIEPGELLWGVFKYDLGIDPGVYMQPYKFDGVNWKIYDGNWKQSESERVALMVHGIFAGNRDDMKPLALHLWNANKYDAIYAVEYHEGSGIKKLGEKLASYIDSKVQTGKIDVFAHSMGGLVSRSAFELSGASNKVNMFVSMSTPHSGVTGAVIANVLVQLGMGIGFWPEYDDLKVGSSFLNELNTISGNNTVHYRAIVGTEARGGSFYGWTSPVWWTMMQPHDGMVEAISSGLYLTAECASYKQLEVLYNHDWVKKSPETFAAIDTWYTELYGVGAPVKKINPIDGAEMVWVRAGEFLRGSDTRYYYESPQRQIYLDGYWMYKYEVTVAQYRAFCQATARSMPDTPSWGWQDTHPMVNVSWYDAVDYASWAGVALPTEAQWEKAARGTDGREYPWGNVWDESKCANWINSSNGPKPVGSYPAGVSPYGCMDMAGNVWEPCADWFDVYYYQTAPSRNPTGAADSPWGVRVLRGGSWNHHDDLDFRCAYRSAADPAIRSNVIGFRCARPE